MAVKNIKYEGSQIMDENGETEGFSCNDELGLYHFYSAYNIGTGEAQRAFHRHVHRVAETRSPIWNQITYDLNRVVTESGLYDGSVTLVGLKDDGTSTPIMQHLYYETNASVSRHIFDLSGSSCANAVIKKTKLGSSGGNNTMEVEVPLQSKYYEDVDIEAAWGYEGWDYRMALQVEKSTGKFRNAKGHNASEYYGINIAVPYRANMTDNLMTDIRFTANDGLTQLPFYILNNVAGSYASVIVAIPWWFLDKEREIFESTSSSTGAVFAHSEPNYIYCYYGNADAISANDSTLSLLTSFFDDFSDNTLDVTKWTVGDTAHGTTTETGEALETNLTGGYTETPSVESATIPSLYMGTTPFEVIFVIDEITPTPTATTTADMPIFRVGVDNSNFTQCYFPWNNAPWGGGAAGVYWRYGSTRGGTPNTPYSIYKHSGTTTTDRYLKLKHIPNSNTSTGGNNIWLTSYDGVHWDFIGQNPISDGPVSGTPKVWWMYQGNSLVAAAKKLRVKKVIVYPVVGNETEYFEDEFTNGANAAPNDRWTLSGLTNATILEAATPGGASSGAPGAIRMSCTNASTHLWDGANFTAPVMYTHQKVNNGLNTEVTMYQTEISGLGAVATRGVAGIAIFNGTTIGTMEALRFGVSKVAAGTCTLEVQRQSNGTVVDVYPAGINVITLPIHLRIVIDPNIKRIFFDYSQDGLEWIRYGASNASYTNLSYHNGTYMGLFMRQTTTNSWTADFEYFKAKSSMRESCYYLTWSAEDARANYPIEVATPAETDIILSFTTPAGMIRNNACYVRTKMYGGAWNKSKMMWLSDQDLIEIGPDGTDKYIGMQLEFDFSFAETDLFSVKAINYLYEVV